MFIDIHVHICRVPSAPRGGKSWLCTPEQLLAIYDQLGIERGVLMPLVSPEFYEPQANTDILEICRDHPGRFIPFCNVDPRNVGNSPNSDLSEILNHYRDLGCMGVGEVTANLRFDDPLVQNLLRHMEAAGMPFVFHMAPRVGAYYGLVDEPGLPLLERSLARFSKLAFIGHSPTFWAEIARLETPADHWDVYPGYPVREEGVLPKLFRRYPNLYGDLSASSGHNALARDRQYAVRFLNEFQDRLLFGTDITGPGTSVPLPAFLKELRETGQISETVFQKVARENTIRLLGL
jgi:uncharacterized protein